ncbi:MAG: hypothetical protein C4581_01040 [Nitrospiraceae bacterium]|nr:MAG: hypothetical protein C4581_01040 [Nitrospiraceae bacterium]
MPHFGLIDNSLGPEEYALQRARLHIRGGKRRLRQGKISAGLVTLYDAAVFALDWYIASPERRSKLCIKEGEDLKDDRTVFEVLKRSGVIDRSFDYDLFNKLIEKSLEQELPDYDYRDILDNFESLMTGLGVMPFDESGLPPEDPSTF